MLETCHRLRRLRKHSNDVAAHDETPVNPITYGGGILVSPDHQIIDHNYKTALSSTSKLGDLYFLPIRHILAEFEENRFSRGLLQLFLKWEVSNAWTYDSFCFAWKPWKCRERYNFVPEKMFSGTKGDLFLVSGVNIDDSYPSGQEIFAASYL